MRKCACRIEAIRQIIPGGAFLPHRVFYTMVRLTSYGIKNNLDNDSGLVGQVKAYMEGVFDMKKWFRPVRVVKKYIDIVVNMDDYKDYKTDTSVAVNPYFPMKVSRPSAIKDWKISDEALSLYIDFLNCVLHIIWSHGLKITKQYWAKKTYAYNIEVKHYGYIHDEKVKHIILFRVNNHINPTLNRGPKFNGGREMTMPVLQDIRVGKFESSMQLYLQYDELEKSHLDVFDNWVKTFALPEQLCEIDVDTSKFRFVRRFSKFFNLPELSRMFSQIAIFHAMDDTEEMPKLESYTDVTIKRFPVLTAYMNSLCERTEAIRGKAVDRRVDNMLKVSTDGRKAALDLRLVGKEQPAGKSSKICQCVERVTALYNKYPQMTQLIFCDYATPKSDAFNVYDALKEKLVQCGIPAAQIAFIHHYHTESRKLELFRKFNAGDIRILIGSTFKLGIGANVQERLKAIHHLDVPWRPADMIQREGRILRRGNQNKNVIIYRYITESSFDSYSWQILETKQRFITQFLTGTTYQRSIEDLENQVLTYA